ncbi:MAG TPA: CYTH and CHAD domain-containing protein [Casimicrobiaceae bacterium]
MSLTPPAELEIKLRIPRSAIAQLLRHPALARHKSGRARRRKLHSTYFDTANLRLADAGVGVRMRRDGHKWIQTAKGPPDAASGGGLTARPEYEWPVGTSPRAPPIDTTRLATTPWRRLLLKAARSGLEPRFITEFMRTEIPLELPERTTAVLAVDVGAIRAVGSARHLEICEIELELASGNIGQLFRLAAELALDVPLSLEPASKAARGTRLVSGDAAKPLRAENADIERNLAAGEALAAIMRACLRQIEGNADGLLRADDPEWIHQMRIGTRRLRACLSLMSRLVTSEPLSRLITDVKWLASALGAARDLDVLALETLPIIRRGSDPTAARAIRSFGAKVAVRRKRARINAREAVASRRFAGLILCAGGLAATPEFGALGKPAPDPPTGTAAREFAAHVLSRRQKKLLHRGEGLPTAPAEARHAARIAAKKLRYATEFFADLFAGKRARRYRKSLTRLQDVLGVMNDAAVAARLAREIAGPDSNAAALLQGWAVAQATLGAPALADAWRDFSRATTFWD